MILTGDGVGDGHEGRVQSWGDAPHRVVPHESCQAEGGHHLGEGGMGGAEAEAK